MIDDARHTIERLATHSQNGAGLLIERAREQLNAVLTMLNKTNEEIRGYIYDLRRSVAGDEDLARGLLDIVTEFRIRTAIPTDWSVDGCSKVAFSPEQRQHIYQIVREALSNIARHASATRAQVELRYDDCAGHAGAQAVRVRISDNGRGIVRPTLQTGRGLLNMQERAALLKADFSVESEPGKGTSVTLVVRAGTRSKS